VRCSGSIRRRRQIPLDRVRTRGTLSALSQQHAQEYLDMTVARITEITAISKKSFDDAVAMGVARANKTLKNVKGAWVKNQEVMVEKGKVVGYKVNLKVTFVLAD
jgi:flavin-binding protein dodecin